MWMWNRGKEDIYIHDQTSAGTRSLPSAIFTASKYDRNLSLNSSLHSARRARALSFFFLFSSSIFPGTLPGSYSHLTSCDNLVDAYTHEDKRIPCNSWRDFHDMAGWRATARKRKRRFEQRTMNCRRAKIRYFGSRRECKQENEILAFHIFLIRTDTRIINRVNPPY